jgi:hypothetical protein
MVHSPGALLLHFVSGKSDQVHPSTLPGGTVTLSRGALKIVKQAARDAETTPEAIVDAAIRMLPSLMEFRGERFPKT